MSTHALIIIDLQNDYFPGGSFTLEGIADASRNAARALETARNNGELVVHVQHVNLRPEAPFFVPDTPGVEIHPSVQPCQGEPVVVKHYPNSFRETNLKAILDEAGVTQVTLAGAMSHMCIDATCRAASDLGFGVTVLHDACATRDLEFAGQVVPAAQVHAAFMAALAFGYAHLRSSSSGTGIGGA